ncbi:hypothetical protein ACJMK2_038421 [Sinanodonta woodiana]|uniref:Carboxymuconolactone decarboxylase-like domain-containing protein n=1 Tax=Sinanodonta woodiana TaxID=1069815 RepID=A0ABD3W8X2_SINWO
MLRNVSTLLSRRIVQDRNCMDLMKCVKGRRLYAGIHTSSKRRSDDLFRFPPTPLNSLPDDLQSYLKPIEEKTGFLPNVFKAMSHHPDELRAFINYYDIVMSERGSLTKAEKEMIIVATSAENNCQYCIIAHGALHRIFSKNPHLADQLAINWRTADIDDRQRSILDFAIDLCHCQPLCEEKFKNLEKHGLSREDAWDIGAVVALFALSNRMAYLTNMKPNKEFYLMGRVPKNKTK